jgi:cell shape-determining protein MreD
VFDVPSTLPAMIALHTILLLAAAFLAVFAQAALPGLRAWVGTQVDLLPPLMVYAALRTNLLTVALLATFGGFGFDALSANPPGVTPLPLLLVGLALHTRRELILRDEAFAQFALGAMASLLVPLLGLLILLSLGCQPLVGWGSLWQLLVLSLSGALLTPLTFGFFRACHRALSYRPASQTSFRADRDIRRGRF